MVSFVDVGKMWDIRINFQLIENQLDVPRREFGSFTVTQMQDFPAEYCCTLVFLLLIPAGNSEHWHTAVCQIDCGLLQRTVRTRADKTKLSHHWNLAYWGFNTEKVTMQHQNKLYIWVLHSCVLGLSTWCWTRLLTSHKYLAHLLTRCLENASVVSEISFSHSQNSLLYSTHYIGSGEWMSERFGTQPMSAACEYFLTAVWPQNHTPDVNAGLFSNKRHAAAIFSVFTSPCYHYG